MNPKTEPINLGFTSCPEIVPDVDALAEEQSLRTVLSDFSGEVVLRIDEFNPDALDLLAGEVGVLRRDGGCPARQFNERTGTRFCCRSAHTDRWHIDGRWPTSVWTCDEYGRPLDEVSR